MTLGMLMTMNADDIQQADDNQHSNDNQCC